MSNSRDYTRTGTCVVLLHKIKCTLYMYIYMYINVIVESYRYMYMYNYYPCQELARSVQLYICMYVEQH